jgi:hypothetical protein
MNPVAVIMARLITTIMLRLLRDPTILTGNHINTIGLTIEGTMSIIARIRSITAGHTGIIIHMRNLTKSTTDRPMNGRRVRKYGSIIRNRREKPKRTIKNGNEKRESTSKKLNEKLKNTSKSRKEKPESIMRNRNAKLTSIVKSRRGKRGNDTKNGSGKRENTGT